MEFIGFNTTGGQQYTSNQRVARVDNCNGYRARNTGDTPVYVNGELLQPGPPGASGEGITDGGNIGEIFFGFINIEFVAPIGARPEVTITQKFYILDKPLRQANCIQ